MVNGPDTPVTNIVYNPVRFMAIVKPNGFLINHMACHALWFYYTLAQRTLEDVVDEPIYYEGEQPPAHNLRQLFVSASHIYGVDPHEMIKFWPNVDLQCIMSGGKKVPAPWRFDKIPEINTETRKLN